MSEKLTNKILRDLGRLPRTDDRIVFSGGDDPVFPTPWRVGSAGAAAWLVRVSLVQVAHWIASLGMVDPAGAASELPDEELMRLCMESDGPLGHLRHLKPVVGMSETPAFYAKPAEPLGTSKASWL